VFERGQPSANCCIVMGESDGSMKEYMREHYDDGGEGAMEGRERRVKYSRKLSDMEEEGGVGRCSVRRQRKLQMEVARWRKRKKTERWHENDDVFDKKRRGLARQEREREREQTRGMKIGVKIGMHCSSMRL
jgi:hypothetical protein